MNTDTLKGKWLQVKGSAKAQWGKLTDDDLTRVEGNAEKLVGLVQERYGYAKDRAAKEVAEFKKRHNWDDVQDDIDADDTPGQFDATR